MVMLVAACVFVANEVREWMDVSADAEHAERFLDDLTELREATARLPRDSERLMLDRKIRDLMTDLRPTARDSPLYATDFNRLSVALTDGADPGVAEAAIAALEEHEQWLMEKFARDAQHEQREAVAGAVAAAALLALLQTWTWLLVRHESRRRAPIEQRLWEDHERLESSVQQRTATLSAANRELAAASRQLLRTQEDTRRTLARELHDELGQQMAALLLNLRMMKSHTALAEMPEATARLRDSIEEVRSIYDRIRWLALELRPTLLDSRGLVPALRAYAEQQESCSDCSISLSADARSNTAPTEIATAVFRIVQEAVQSSLREGDSEHIAIILQCHHDHLDLCIHDDGKAVPPGDLHSPDAGVQTVGMRERATLLGGTFATRSTPDGGTEINVRLPLRDKAEAGATAP